MGQQQTIIGVQMSIVPRLRNRALEYGLPQSGVRSYPAVSLAAYSTGPRWVLNNCLLNEQINERPSLHQKYITQRSLSPHPDLLGLTEVQWPICSPPLPQPLSPPTLPHIHLHSSAYRPPEACRVEATGPCSTYQDPLTPLPGVCGVIALVQGKAHVARILQLPIGELDCKIAARE